MTSMPASRSALAMIFAPRSWPSRPGFAITTRIVPGTSAEYRGAPDRHRLVAGMAEPRQRALRVHARGRREPRAARLRARACSADCASRAMWPEVDAIAITHWHLDHWGDLVPWVWGTFYLVGERPDAEAGALGAARRRRVPRRRSASGSASPTCSSARSTSTEYEPDTPFSIGKLAVTPTRVPHYRLETYAFRVQANGAVLAYSGDSAPSRRARATRRAMPTSSSVKRRSSAASSTASRAGTSPSTRRSRRSRPPARSGCWSRTAPASCRRPTSFELAYDGLELDV